MFSNILHNFTSYTYRISLFLLTKEDFKELGENPSSFEPKHSLISTGGGYAKGGTVSTTRSTTMMGGYTDNTETTKGRHPDFYEDFFIENLQLDTIVGLNNKNKASNAVGISFTIIEPYGMTLLDRLLSACEVTAKCRNYVEQPYLLEIDFLSNVTEQFKTDENSPQGILIDRKRFAIRMREMKIKPGPAGTEYRISAIPYNHTAFSQSKAVMPINVSVEAKTLSDFFDSSAEFDSKIGEEATKNNERVEAELEKWKQQNTVVFANIPPTPEAIAAKRAELTESLSYTVASLPAAYNDYQRSLSQTAKIFTQPQQLIAFKLHKSFADSLLVDGDRTVVGTQPMIKSLEGINVTLSGYAPPEYKTKQVFMIHAGTDIINIIDRVMMSSKYIKDQVLEAKKTQADDEQKNTESSTNTRATDSTTKDTENKFVDWYKIIPTVKILAFDESRNAYSKQLIYNIVPFKTANPSHPDLKKTEISSKKIVRDYQYLYTGLNQDILSVDIDFDSSFYTELTSFQDAKTRSGSNYLAESPFLNPTQIQARDGGDTNREQTLPVTYVAVGSEQQNSSTMNKGSDSKDQAIASFSKSIYTNSRGAMLNIRLKIVGDPAYIKQDDIYYNPMSSDYEKFIAISDNGGESVPINPQNKQIIFDKEDVYVKFSLKSIVDIDDELGITNKQIKLSNGRVTDSSFTGIYKVQRVTSEFRQGKFEQSLELIRMPNDIKDETKNTTNSGAKVMQPISNTPGAVSPVTPPSPPPAVSTSPAIVPPLPGLVAVSQLPATPINDTSLQQNALTI